MKKKNQKLLIIVGVLLLFGGVSLAYFVSSTTIKGNGALVDVTTSEINGVKVKVEGVLNFDDANIYPGHKNIASVKLTATGDNELIPYNLIWSGTNTINTSLNYTVYKTNDELSVASTCNKKTEIINGVQALSEECTISNIENLGNEIASGTINRGDTKATLISDEFITAVTNGISYYYYIILEYPNLDEEQNEDINGVLNGKIKAEESNIKPDINILAAYVIQDDGEYQQVNDIPQSGYVINTSKSTCSNGAVPSWKDNGLFVSSLTKSGTSCYLYFDKYVPTASDIILANITYKTTTPDFSKIATSDEGVFETTDEMYDNGKTYYWRGAVTDNYVKFAGFCWRIIRINGDKTIRMIYDGTTCHANGTSTTENLAQPTSGTTRYAYNSTFNASYYVGWTYSSNQRPILSINSITGLTEGGTSSNAKNQIESWYNSNIIGTDTTKVADGKYCNDRDVGQPLSSWSGTWTAQWSVNGIPFAYAGTKRLYESYSPTFNCPSGDVYTLKVGLITADEVKFAGGKDENNTSYYLYNGQKYWTMSPCDWSTDNRAYAFCVESNGRLSHEYVSYADLGLRPVINLKADTQFSSGNGEQSTPYIVES